jgi:hypothetical protein
MSSSRAWRGVGPVLAGRALGASGNGRISVVVCDISSNATPVVDEAKREPALALVFAALALAALAG